MSGCKFISHLWPSHLASHNLDQKLLMLVRAD